MGLPLTIVERLAIGAADGQARDRHRVASLRVSALLEKSAWRWPPEVSPEVRNLIRQMSDANPRWSRWGAVLRQNSATAECPLYNMLNDLSDLSVYWLFQTRF